MKTLAPESFLKKIKHPTSDRHSKIFKATRVKQYLLGLIIAATVMGPLPSTFAAGPAPVNLRSTSRFAILSGAAITTTGGGIIQGDVGASPIAGSAIHLTAAQVNGTIYAVDASGPAGSVTDASLLTTAKGDLTTAYIEARDLTPVPSGPQLNPGGGNIGGMNLAPGLYKFTGTALITGANLTLTGGANDVWIFQIAADLQLGSSIQIILAGGARAGNVYWQVGTSANIGTFAVFKGTILADQAITMNTSSTIEGRALAFAAGVTFNGAGGSLPVGGGSGLPVGGGGGTPVGGGGGLPVGGGGGLPASTSNDIANLSVRLKVQLGDNVAIGGFVITGTASKTVLVRASGPSLTAFNVSGALADTTLELHDSAGALVAQNDDWRSDHEVELNATGMEPLNDRESAILISLAPGAYTAIVRGKNLTSGVTLLEVYDMEVGNGSKLVNVSARGKIENGDNVMIEGFVFGGTASKNIIIRAIGPDLQASGVSGTLNDTTLELHDATGALVATNDNWRSSQQGQIINSTLPPTNDLDSALVATLAPGSYTAIARGKSGSVGVALLEIYELP